MLEAGALHKIVPELELNSVRVVHDAPDMLTRLRAARDGQPLTAQKYTRLLIDGAVWMTDTEFECWTNAEVIKATGDILIAGLGLGLVLRPLLKSRAVKSVTVLENSADVIAAIEPIYKHKKLTVILADARTWIPPKRAFDFIYFDIWKDVPNSNNKADIQALKKRYRPALKIGGRSRAWCESHAYRKESLW